GTSAGTSQVSASASTALASHAPPCQWQNPPAPSALAPLVASKAFRENSPSDPALQLSRWPARRSVLPSLGRRHARRGSMDFNGRMARRTGAASGIGRAAALAFAVRGAKVQVVDKDAAGAERTAATIRQLGGHARAQAADVTKSADVEAYVKAALEGYG